jgi:hypothetical protein
LIFFGVPPLLQPVEGGGSVKGEREIRDEVSFSGELETLESNEKAVTSLKAYRVEFIGPLTEYPGTDNGRGEIKNHPLNSSCSVLSF